MIGVFGIDAHPYKWVLAEKMALSFQCGVLVTVIANLTGLETHDMATEA